MRSNRVIPKRKKNAGVVWQMRWKTFVKFSPIISLFTIIGVAFWQLSNLQLLTVTTHISSNGQQIKRTEIQNNIQPLLTLPLNLRLIKNKILQHPWVSQVNVKRKWNKLNISIIEQEIHFNWHNIENNKKGYINQADKLFIPENIAINDHITIISDEQDSTIAATHLRKYLQILSDNPIDIKQFIKTKIETLVLQNGAKIILGQRLQEKRLAKLSKYYHHFKMRENSIVDLRYPNGFAKTN